MMWHIFPRVLNSTKPILFNLNLIKSFIWCVYFGKILALNAFNGSSWPPLRQQVISQPNPTLLLLLIIALWFGTIVSLSHH